MNISEKKILNAIIYFVKNTTNCRKTKLFKLMYFLDFKFFKKYGRTVTGYNYIAMPFGPVPIELFEQITNDTMPGDFKKAFKVIEEVDDEDSKSFKIVIKSGINPDLEWLSKKEADILEEVAFTFQNATAAQMVEITHLKNSPWDQTMKKGGIGSEIDFYLAIDDESTLDLETITERFKSQQEMKMNGRF